jgi:hypothetical protein
VTEVYNMAVRMRREDFHGADLGVKSMYQGREIWFVFESESPVDVARALDSAIAAFKAAREKLAGEAREAMKGTE